MLKVCACGGLHICVRRLTVSIFCESGSNMHHTNSSSSISPEDASRGVAVEKFDIMKKWGLNTYKVCQHHVIPIF